MLVDSRKITDARSEGATSKRASACYRQPTILKTQISDQPISAVALALAGG
jgi:hypothetical protein